MFTALIRRKPCAVTATAVLLATCPVAGHAADALAIRDQGPGAVVFGLPRTPVFAGVEPNRNRFAIHTELVQNFTDQDNSRAAVRFDGETSVTEFAWQRTFGPGAQGRYWSTTLAVPYIVHSGGFLDAFIDTFHDTFGLPDSGRDRADRNDLAYLHLTDRASAPPGVLTTAITDSRHGFGDVRLTLARHGSAGSSDWLIAAHLKLPTGEEHQLTGSGSLDAGLSAALRNTSWLARANVTVQAGAGVLVTGSSDAFDAPQEDVVGFGHLALAWQVTRHLVLNAQLDARSPFHDSALDPLGGFAFAGTLGGYWQFADRWRLEVGVVEDLGGAATSDVTFSFALRRR